MAEQIQTTWIWHDEMTGGTMGAIVDLDHDKISWLDQPGCACGDSSQSQSIQNFLDTGAIGAVPQDIVDEMREELRRHTGQIVES